MAALLLIFLGWNYYVTKYLNPKHPEWSATQPAVNSGDAGGPAAPSPGSAGSTVISTSQAATQTGGAATMTAAGPGSISPSTMPAGLRVDSTGATGITTIGWKPGGDAQYAVGMNISPDGAGLDSVDLAGFKAIDGLVQYEFQQPYDNHEDLKALAATSIVITINGQAQTVDLKDVAWKLESSGTASATFGVNIVAGNGQPVMHLTKTYLVDPIGKEKEIDDTAAGYETTITYHFVNTGATAETAMLSFEGPTMPPKEVERGADRQVVSGYDTGSRGVEVIHHTLDEFKSGAETKDLFANPKGYSFLWAGASSAYFAAIVRPDPSGRISAVAAKALNPEADADNRIIVIDFTTTDLAVPVGGSTDLPLKVFLGPKRRSMLEGTYYADYPRDYKDIIVNSTMFGCPCALPFLIDGLVDLLRFFHYLLRDWGLAIIALVVLVRLILHPITKSSQVSMMKMQKMGPELERLKKKYGDDKDGYAKAQMQLYKEVGFTPILGCLPMFLQMPIWIALYSALQNEIALRQSPFLWGFTWIHDLARPDRLFAWDVHPIIIPWLGWNFHSLNILPMFLAVVFFLQQKFTPKPPAATPEQAQQQKMMQWMSLLFPVFLYTAPAGLNLYILTSTTIGIIESKRIRDHIKQKQEAEKEGKVFVDAKPTRQGKLQKRDDETTKEPPKVGKLAKLWADLQAKAEQIRKEAEKGKK